MINECLQLILLAQSALVPPSIDELVHKRLASSIKSTYNLEVKHKDNGDPCDHTFQYFYTPGKVVVIGDNQHFRGRQDLLIDDLLDGKSVSLPKHSLGSESPLVATQTLEKPAQPLKLSKTTQWIAGGLGLILGGLLIHRYTQKSQDPPNSPPTIQPATPPDRIGPKPINF